MGHVDRLERRLARDARSRLHQRHAISHTVPNPISHTLPHAPIPLVHTPRLCNGRGAPLSSAVSSRLWLRVCHDHTHARIRRTSSGAREPKSPSAGSRDRRPGSVRRAPDQGPPSQQELGICDCRPICACGTQRRIRSQTDHGLVHGGSKLLLYIHPPEYWRGAPMMLQ